MALRLPQFPLYQSKITFLKSKYLIPPKFIKIPINFSPTLPNFASEPRKCTAIPKASPEPDDGTTTTGENTVGPSAKFQPENPQTEEMTELGVEIKKAMMERQQKEEGGFLSGVAQEVREIEWPAFNKVLGITGVVLGVIAGSSVVLLTVNAVLAEISDQVFAGKGVQDFFG